MAFNELVHLVQPSPQSVFAAVDAQNRPVSGTLTFVVTRPPFGAVLSPFLAIEARINDAIPAQDVVIAGRLGNLALVAVDGVDYEIIADASGTSLQFGKSIYDSSVTVVSRLGAVADINLFQGIRGSLVDAILDGAYINTTAHYITGLRCAPSNTLYPRTKPTLPASPLQVTGPSSDIRYNPVTASESSDTITSVITKFEIPTANYFEGIFEPFGTFSTAAFQRRLIAANLQWTIPHYAAIVRSNSIFSRRATAGAMVRPVKTIVRSMWTELIDYQTSEGIVTRDDVANVATFQYARWRVARDHIDPITVTDRLLDNRGAVWNIRGIDRDIERRGLILSTDRTVS